METLIQCLWVKMFGIAQVLVWYCIAILEPWNCIGIVLLENSQYWSCLLYYILLKFKLFDLKSSNSQVSNKFQEIIYGMFLNAYDHTYSAAMGVLPSLLFLLLCTVNYYALAFFFLSSMDISDVCIVKRCKFYLNQLFCKCRKYKDYI